MEDKKRGWEITLYKSFSHPGSSLKKGGAASKISFFSFHAVEITAPLKG
jgi:hypothetical protein